MLPIGLAAVLSGCLVGSEPIVKVDRFTHISLLSNTENRDEPPVSLLGELTRQDC